MHHLRQLQLSAVIDYVVTTPQCCHNVAPVSYHLSSNLCITCYLHSDVQPNRHESPAALSGIEGRCCTSSSNI